jgi:DNA ligase (NAD+)
MSDLAKAILYHKKMYYQGTPVISDREYDLLEEALRREDPNHPVLMMVGSEPEGENPKVPHDLPMLSLNKTYKIKTLLTWQKRRPILGAYKIDGNSLSLIYQGGQLVQAKTRGNGFLGEDVTGKIRWVSGVPQRIRENTLTVEVRGELSCSGTSFQELALEMARRNLPPPSNPRNIVAGILGRKRFMDLAAYFNFFAFDVHLSPSLFQTEGDKILWLKEEGFQVPPWKHLETKSEVEEFIQRAQTHGEDYGVDGAVFTLWDTALHKELGHTAHHPRYRLSYKWQGEKAWTQLVTILWSTSRLGTVTPVALVKPVSLGGASIRAVTLHNAIFFSQLGLFPGASIEIIRAGEVIPKFLRLDPESHPQGSEELFRLPGVCPACETVLVLEEVHLRCPNKENCQAQEMGAILHWVKSVGVDDLSDKRLLMLKKAGFLTQAADIYKLTPGDFLTLPSTKEKLAERLFQNIQKTKTLDLTLFLSALGIPGGGKETWKKITAFYPTISEIQKVSSQELIKIKGIGSILADTLTLGLKEQAQNIEALLSSGIVLLDKPLEAEFLFVLTGTLSRPRKDIEALLKSKGFGLQSQVTKATHALVEGEGEGGSVKSKKAGALGIQIWTETEFYDFLGE